jgi:hypothetical protein
MKSEELKEGEQSAAYTRVEGRNHIRIPVWKQCTAWRQREKCGRARGKGFYSGQEGGQVPWAAEAPENGERTPSFPAFRADERSQGNSASERVRHAPRHPKSALRAL